MIRFILLIACFLDGTAIFTDTLEAFGHLFTGNYQIIEHTMLPMTWFIYFMIWLTYDISQAVVRALLAHAVRPAELAETRRTAHV